MIKNSASMGTMSNAFMPRKANCPINIPAPINTEMVPMTEDLIPEGDDSAGMVRINVSLMDHRPPIEQPYPIAATTGPSPIRHAITNTKSPMMAMEPRSRHTFFLPSLSENIPASIVIMPLKKG